MMTTNVNTSERDISLMATDADTTTDVNPPPSLSTDTTANNKPTNSNGNGGTSTRMSNTTNEINRPTYDISNPRSVLRALIRYVMRTFYDVPKSLIVECIFFHGRIKQQDLAARLCLEKKDIRSFIEDLKRDNFIIEDHRLDIEGGVKAQKDPDQYYYKLDTKRFINVVKYRLANMRTYAETREKQQAYRQSNYKCTQCGKEYSDLDVSRLLDSNGKFICKYCDGIVEEDEEAEENANNQSRKAVTMSLFNEQMEKLFEILEQIDQNMLEQQRISNLDGNGLIPGGNTNANNQKQDYQHINYNRSQASNIFDQTIHLSYDIEVIIEKDDDEYSLNMDTDDLNNAESTISSSRGPAKLSKKSHKSLNPGSTTTDQSIPRKHKSSSQKTAYEPKPLPHWFLYSTISFGMDDSNNAGSTSLQSTNSINSSSRLSLNQRNQNSSSQHDIKQMLLVHESCRNEQNK